MSDGRHFSVAFFSLASCYQRTVSLSVKVWVLDGEKSLCKLFFLTNKCDVGWHTVTALRFKEKQPFGGGGPGQVFQRVGCDGQ